MARFIDAETLIKDIESRRLVFKSTITVAEALLSQGNVIRKAIEEAPTAGVAEVVRCKDCQYYTANCGGTYVKGDGRCDHPELFAEYADDAWLETHPDSFCSYGIRKETK